MKKEFVLPTIEKYDFAINASEFCADSNLLLSDYFTLGAITESQVEGMTSKN